MTYERADDLTSGSRRQDLLTLASVVLLLFRLSAVIIPREMESLLTAAGLVFRQLVFLLR